MAGAGHRRRGGEATVCEASFFDTQTDHRLDALAGRLAQPGSTMIPATSPEKPNGRVWVTRAAIYVDRIASAWLIRRFIDPAAQFRFVVPTATSTSRASCASTCTTGNSPTKGDLCTFETLCRHYALADPGSERDRRDRARHRLQGREVRPPRDAGRSRGAGRHRGGQLRDPTAWRAGRRCSTTCTPSSGRADHDHPSQPWPLPERLLGWIGAAPPDNPEPLPGPRGLPAYARVRWSRPSADALPTRLRLLVAQLAALRSGCATARTTTVISRCAQASPPP